MSSTTTLQEELAEEEKVLRAEQEWFLTTQVKPGLEAIQKSLLACQEAARLQDDAKGALTLAISSTNNDTLKGFVTLAGCFIVKGDLTVKLPKLPVVKTSIHSHVPSNAVPSLSLSSNTASTVAAASTSAPSAAAATATTAEATEGAESSNKETAQALTSQEESEGSKGDAQQSNLQGSDQALEQVQDIPTNESTTTSQASAPKATSETLLDPTMPPPPPTNTHQLMNSYRPPGHVTQPYLLEQLKDVQNHTAQAIFRLEDYWSRGGDDTLSRLLKKQNDGASSSAAIQVSSAQDIKEATRSLKTLLELMERHLRAGIEAMARPRKEKLYPFRVCDPKIFSPALNEDFVIEFYVRDSQLVCAAYALQLSGGSNNSGATSGGITGYLQQALPGASTSTPQYPPQYNRTQSTSSKAASLASNSDNQQQLHNGDHGTKSGQMTPPTHLHQSQQPQFQPGGNGIGRSRTNSSATTQQLHHSLEHHPNAGSAAPGPPSNESVVLPSSSKIGQTSKGGINKYRGKVATTIEDKVVQVESPKLTEISARLAHSEGLCRRLLQFLALQESAAVFPN
ncbi:hypothetical protein BGX21_010601 [Mortierella sp. AD011]|nr:hypothetical protein BGX20_006625 [Mortierella sp. AD010]KAF9393855.1 hypothetical protein BGX21_010601 [Mortierella sp. AD011]